MDSALEIEYAWELERFNLGTVVIKHTTYTVLTGYEGTGRCFWCGGELKGKLKRYCRGHMEEYYRHFEWGSASRWALKRAGYVCENCGVGGEYILYGLSRRYNLEVHHIVPLNGRVRSFSAFNLPWNLIVLCHECHLAVHEAMRPPKHHPMKGFDSWDDAIKAGQGVMPLGLS